MPPPLRTHSECFCLVDTNPLLVYHDLRYLAKSVSRHCSIGYIIHLVTMSQQPRPNVDRLRPSQHHRQKQKKVHSGRIQKSKSKESLTTIPSAMPSLTSGQSTNR